MYSVRPDSLPPIPAVDRGDDGPRLRFADAVESSDPRRARFVRLSCEYARTEETDERHAVLEAELARCSPEAVWHADIAGVRGLTWGYQRGFVGYLRASGATLARDADALLAHPVDQLAVDVKAKEVKDLLASGILGRVRALTLIGPARASREVLASGALGELRELVLDSDDKGLRALLDLPAMEHLESLSLRLTGNVAGGIALLAGSTRLGGLRHLEVRADPRTVPLDVAVLARASWAHSLRSLVLGSLEGMDGARALTALQALESLEVWDLDEAAGPVLCGGLRASGLRRLRLQHASRAAVVALAGNPAVGALQSLELGGLLQTRDVVGDEGVEALARSSHLQNLLALDLGGCAMGARGAEALAAASAFPTLRVLNLQRRNRLGGEGAKALARWSSLRGVHTLYLPVEEPEPLVVLGPLLESGAISRVRRLDLWGPADQAGDAVLEALGRTDLPQLSHLAMARRVNSASFRAKGARILLESECLPSLAILWARLKAVPTALRAALTDRFLVRDSESESGLGSTLPVFDSR